MEAGIILIKTDFVKISFEKLAKSWKEMYANSLNARARMEL